MQPKIRVSLVAEKDKDARKLIRLFEQFPEFAVVDTFAAAGNGAKTFDVQVVHAEHLAQLSDHFAKADGPTLYLVPHGVRPNELRAPNAMLPPDAPTTQIRAAAMAVAAGLQIAQKTDFDADGESEFAFVEPLTDRELHILNLVADGLSNPQIARRLAISRNTVKFHISSIIAKLGATSRTEAVTIGVKRGLIIL
ncbi:MAG TPA: helix-turn-helix transcriptional regulator [Terriglobales bacterium]|jgi:DNA-binding CsgD family transcriptional regulator|nr:helix-turn-helix transcriptional regulator [Terriglobales bacterium]